MSGNARGSMQRDSRPDLHDVAFRNTSASQKNPARRLHHQPRREVDFSERSSSSQAEIMKHRRGVKQFRIDYPPFPVGSEGAPKMHARRVLEEKVPFRVPNVLRDLLSENAVGNPRA